MLLTTDFGLLTLRAAVGTSDGQRTAHYALAGKPWARYVIDNSSTGADGVKSADANGDGRPDIITGWEEGGEVRLYLNPGADKSREAWPRVTVGKVSRPEDAALVDLDGDSELDALSATEGDGRTVFIHWAPREKARLLDPNAWTTQPIAETRGQQMWMFLLPLQIDGRAGTDIVTGSKLKDAAIGWLRAPANPRDAAAWTWNRLRPAGWIMSLLPVDMDGDSDSDLLFSDRRGAASGIGWLENPGAAAADRGEPWREHPVAAQGREVMFLDTGNFDDGRFAIAAAVKPSSILLLHREGSGGWREEWIEVSAQCGTAKAVKLADLDLDGRTDLVYSCEGATGDLRGVIWLRREAGRWQAHDLGGPEGTKFDLVATLDLDSDGDLDVLTCEETDNLGVVWYENPARTSNQAAFQRSRGNDPTADLTALPEVPPGFTVSLFAQEPLVRNPCSIAFDERGRLFVGFGPQYRKPAPDTPPDSIVILEDTNSDGVADRSKTFASGFNCIQGLAWRGRDLYVANSPDLTIVRDLDGDDEADEYVKLYTDLGNIEHALHGLNFAPDGRLYMSKGNSKGLSQPERVAPKAFRELWGIGAPPGSPDIPPPQAFKKGAYKATYQDPEDDWGREGGVLRCDPDGGNLEIVSRGLRNPWDITYSDAFDWLGTDNDQTPGDRIFSPFPGAHFGWNHGWSSSWTGENHLPTAPVSGPLFDGSGTGVVFYDSPEFPASHRGVFFIGDWLRKVVYLYRPHWDGGLLLPKGDALEEFLRGGNALFRPTDIEVGPDGALYVLGWGKDYGATWKDGKQANEGRVFRITATERAISDSPRSPKPLSQWPVNELISDFARPLPVWRINAQEELVRRGAGVVNELQQVLGRGKLTVAQETWVAWTLGRIAIQDPKLDEFFTQNARLPSTLDPQPSTNLRLQSLRILGERAHRADRPLAASVADALRDSEPRLRQAAVCAIREARAANFAKDLWTLTATETDRIVFYSAWNALRDLLSAEALKAKLADIEPGVRRAALLALLESRSLKPEEVQAFARDADASNAALARLFLEKSGVIEPSAAAALAGSERAPMGPIASPLQIPTRPTTVADVLSLVAGCDAKRGEQIFMSESGAACWTCHRIGNRGRAFGPDLTTVGDRSDARHLAESVLTPNAIVTEGYASLQVSTRDETDITGLLLEETDSILTLAQAAGPPLRIRKDRLTNRQSLHTSPMPSFAEALGPQDTADIVTFLLAQRSPSPSASLPAKPVSKPPSAEVAFAAKDNSLAITIAGKPFATYVFKDPKVLRPYLAHVRALSGTQVTRNFPPVAGQDAIDHDAMHPGIWFGVGDLSGADFWRNQATVEHVRFVSEARGGEDAGEFTVLNRYVHNGNPLAEETARWRFLVRERGVLIMYESEFRPAGEEFYFGDQEEIGFGIRVATPLAVKNGGWMRDNLGRRDEKEIWGKTANWVAYGGRIGDETVGVLLMPSPSNFRPCWFHARDYGFVAANPFGRKAFTGGEPSRVVVKRGETLRLGYGMLVFASATGREPDFAKGWQDFMDVMGSSRPMNEK